MKKLNLLTPILGLTTATVAIVPVASCSCSTTIITKDAGIEKVETSKIETGKDVTITVTYKTGYKFKAIKVTIDGKEVAADMITVSADGKTITVKGAAVTSNKIKIEITSEQASSKIAITYTKDAGSKGDWADWVGTNPTEIDSSATSLTISIKIKKDSGSRLVIVQNLETGVKLNPASWLVEEGAVGDTLTKTFTWTGNPTKFEFFITAE